MLERNFYLGNVSLGLTCCGEGNALSSKRFSDKQDVLGLLDTNLATYASHPAYGVGLLLFCDVVASYRPYQYGYTTFLFVSSASKKSDTRKFHEVVLSEMENIERMEILDQSFLDRLDFGSFRL